jgi:hypothetical protein
VQLAGRKVVWTEDRAARQQQAELDGCYVIESDLPKKVVSARMVIRNIPLVVEACTNLANPIWSPLATNTLSNGSSYFSDPQWTNYPTRFYRLRSP